MEPVFSIHISVAWLAGSQIRYECFISTKHFPNKQIPSVISSITQKSKKSKAVRWFQSILKWYYASAFCCCLLMGLWLVERKVYIFKFFFYRAVGWVLLAQVWRWSNLSQQHPTCRNTTQHGGQTRATCCAQQCCDMLRLHVAIVWLGLKSVFRVKCANWLTRTKK